MRKVRFDVSLDDERLGHFTMLIDGHEEESHEFVIVDENDGRFTTFVALVKARMTWSLSAPRHSEGVEK